MTVVVVAIVLALAGCASAPAVPAGPTAAEVQRMQHKGAADWWITMFPGETVPEVAVVSTVFTYDQQNRVVGQCLDDFLDADPAFTAQGAGYTGDYGGTADFEDLDRWTWTCYQQHPMDAAGDHNLLSSAQLQYAYAYFNERVVPCLQELGYDIPRLIDVGVGSQEGVLAWSPYWAIAELVQTPADWNVIREQCPPPPIQYEWAIFPGG